MIYAIGFYFILLTILVFILSPKKRYDFRGKKGYEKNLHIFVLIRQLLLFLLPLMLSIVVFGVSFVSNQLLSLVVLGVSINVFWVVQLPLLTKANLFVDFSVDNIEKFDSRIEVNADKEHLIYTRIYNMGFSTLKNATVLIYFGKGFNVIGFKDSRYRDLDFEKMFTIQKCNSGVLFTPKDNFQTIVPQEWYLFPVIVKTPKKVLDKIEVQF